MEYIYILLIIFLAVHAVFVFITIDNLLNTPRFLNKEYKLKNNPYVSVLIPMRNEEKNAAHCLDAVLNQSYGNYEVIVLNDNSEDRTGEIVNKYALNSDRVEVISGEELPDGWTGKNFACHQLSERARGEVLLFLDADVTLQEHALSSALHSKEYHETNAVSCFPTQKMETMGEHLIVPLMNWLLLTFLSLRKVFTSKNRAFTAANGQFIMIDKKTYTAIGGHKSVKNEIVEDMEIARKLKTEGYSIATSVGYEAVYCRMYNNFSDAWYGFSKNFFPGFNTIPVVFVLMLFLFLFIFGYPVFLSITFPGMMVIAALIFIERAAVSLLSRQNLFINIILHPVQMVMMFLIGVNSVFLNKSGKMRWKGRTVQTPN